MASYIEAINITKNFPIIKSYRDILLRPFEKKEITALNGVNLSIQKGELFGLLGSNGAGKTTLIKIFCTLVLPTSGKAFVDGLDVTIDGKDIRKKIGYVFSDERSFYWRLTGRQNLKFFAILNNISKCEIERRITQVLLSVGLLDDANRRFKDYSTGMKKKLAIARGLIVNPVILFMDEPTSGLDPLIANDIKRLVRKKIVEEEGRTVILTTHNLKEAEELCDRVAVIDSGMIKAEGSVHDLKRQVASVSRYIFEFKNTKDSQLKVLEKICQIKLILSKSNRSNSDSTKIEIEVPNNNGSGSSLLRDIFNSGVNITSFYEKTASLEEIYSNILKFNSNQHESRNDILH